MSIADSRRYCARRVRRLDRDRYLVSLFAPDRARPALMALCAFNVELSGVADSVSEPALGAVRLRWWRDAVAGIYDRGGGGLPAHAVAGELAQAVAAHGLGRARLERMIDARAADLDPAGIADLGALEGYAADTAGCLSALISEALGAAAPEALAAADHAGRAWGLAGLLRAAPYHASRRRLFLPRGLLEDAGVAPGWVFSAPPPELGPALAPVVEAVAAAARSHLRAARALAGAAPPPVTLPLVLAETWLDRLERRGFDVFAPGLEPSALARPLRLAWAALRAR